jgi:predicted component of type VI protein secretion system
MNVNKRKSTSALVALTAVISMTAAACGSSDPAPTDEPAGDVTVPADDAPEVTTPAAGTEAPVTS